MSRDEQERLRDIKDAIVAIRRHLAQTDETAAAKEDPLLHDALLFQFVVIGEAVKHLASETRKSAPEIPWIDTSRPRGSSSSSSNRGVEADRYTVQGFEALSAALSGAVNGGWRVPDADGGRGVIDFAQKGELWQTRRGRRDARRVSPPQGPPLPPW